MRYFYSFSLPLFVLFFATLNSLSETNAPAVSEKPQMLSGLAAPVAGSTNAPDVFEKPPVAPDLVFPVTVSTNAAGVIAHHFSMRPAITNMAVATNDLAQLKAELAVLDAELKQVSDESSTTRKTMRGDFMTIVGVMTNFTTQTPEGRKLQARITALENELQEARQELQKKMDEDAAYRKAKTKIELDRDGMKKTAGEMEKLRKKRADAAARVWQLQTMIDQTRQEEEARAKAKEAQEKEAKDAKEKGSKEIPPANPK